MASHKRGRFKLTSDGTPRGTQIIDLETGQAIPFVEVDVHFSWLDGRVQAPELTIKTYGHVELEGGGHVVRICPRCQGEIWEQVCETAQANVRERAAVEPPRL